MGRNDSVGVCTSDCRQLASGCSHQPSLIHSCRGLRPEVVAEVTRDPFHPLRGCHDDSLDMTSRIAIALRLATR